MSVLLDHRGQPVSSADFKKAPAPALGERHGKWGGEHASILSLPGGGFINFDLSRLTLADFRQMTDHYQINSSLSLLTFMLHQLDWHVECENKKIAEEAESQLRDVWSRLVRAMSTSFWSGYSPNVLQWDNDVRGKRIVLDKVKDLVPEDCLVNWKKTGPHNSIAIYDGIRQLGATDPIPTENSFWYPLLMQNGDYYGRKLLRPAFQPWFFSILIHLFANRYFERFGEPTPVGRAPMDEVVTFDGTEMNSAEMMKQLLTRLQSRGVVVLPNDKSPNANETNPDFDYTIEYLESQMRGADFEKYMTRLDEEMSLALFTPILMMRTADVGSYNLGVGHMQSYMLMLNAISADWAHYIDRYILAPIARFNFSENHPPVKIKFRRLGKENLELVRDIIRAKITAGQLKTDIRELSEIAGLTLEEQEGLTGEESPENDDEGRDPNKKQDPKEDKEVPTTVKKIAARVAPQIAKAYRRDEMPSPEKIDLGYERELVKAFRTQGSPFSAGAAVSFRRGVEAWMRDVEGLKAEFPTEASYMDALEGLMFHIADSLLGQAA